MRAELKSQYILLRGESSCFSPSKSKGSSYTTSQDLHRASRVSAKYATSSEDVPTSQVERSLFSRKHISNTKVRLGIEDRHHYCLRL